MRFLQILIAALLLITNASAFQLGVAPPSNETSEDPVTQPDPTKEPSTAEPSEPEDKTVESILLGNTSTVEPSTTVKSSSRTPSSTATTPMKTTEAKTTTQTPTTTQVPTTTEATTTSQPTTTKATTTVPPTTKPPTTVTSTTEKLTPPVVVPVQPPTTTVSPTTEKPTTTSQVPTTTTQQKTTTGQPITRQKRKPTIKIDNKVFRGENWDKLHQRLKEGREQRKSANSSFYFKWWHVISYLQVLCLPIAVGVVLWSALTRKRRSDKIVKKAESEKKKNKKKAKKPKKGGEIEMEVLPDEQIKKTGPLHLQKDFQGEMRHRLDGQKSHSIHDKLEFDPELNEEVQIGSDVEIIDGIELPTVRTELSGGSDTVRGEASTGTLRSTRKKIDSFFGTKSFR